MICKKNENNYWTKELIKIIQTRLSGANFQLNLNLLPSLPPGWNLVKLQNNQYVYKNNSIVILPFIGNCIALWGITNSIYTGNGDGYGEPVADKILSELFLNFSKYGYELEKNPSRELQIKVANIELSLFSYTKEILCTNKLSNNSCPLIKNYNFDYPWTNSSPNWDYQQKVQYNPSGQFYLSNMKIIEKLKQFTNNTCINNEIIKKNPPYPKKYVKSLEEVLLQKKAIELAKDVKNIFL